MPQGCWWTGKRCRRGCWWTGKRCCWGTIDIVSDIAGGLSPLFNYNPTQVQQTQQPNNQQTNNQQTQQSNYQQPTTQRTTAPYLGTNHVSGQVKTDNYSYFGKLPSNRASNYMPITTDFSSFS